jgi:protoheme IX farnesyltransferase
MNLLARLFKIKIALMAALSAGTGYLLTGRPAGWDLLLPVVATLVLACGSAALNEFQERDLDGRMQRTAGRPLPSGAISPRGAVGLAGAMIVLGLGGLAIGSGWPAAALGALAVIWYNAVYTPMKRRTAFAAVIGAPVGAIPPAVGWVAAGGAGSVSPLLILMVFLFLWQVPHFWLLLLEHEDEYRQAGLPTLASLFSPTQVRRVTFAWTMAMAAACAGFPLFGIARNPVVFTILMLLTGLQAARATALLRSAPRTGPGLRPVFTCLNAYTVLVLVVAALDRGFGLWRI